MKNKIISMLLIGGMAAGAAACGRSGNGNPDAGSVSGTQTAPETAGESVTQEGAWKYFAWEQAIMRYPSMRPFRGRRKAPTLRSIRNDGHDPAGRWKRRKENDGKDRA